MNEQALVFAAKNGNEKSFEALYKLYYQKVYALARATLKNEADAEDVLQSTFIAAWKNISALEDTSAFNTWIQRITLNQCYALLRKSKPTVSIDDEENEENGIEEIESDLMLPEVYSQREDLRVRLGNIVNSLSDVQRQTIQLYYYDELPVEEIAEVMDCSTGTVKSRLFLGRKAIRTEIEEIERKTGEKFFGVAGISFVGFAFLFKQQAEAAVLAPDKAAAILSKLRGAFVTGAAQTASATAAQTAQSAAAAQSAATTGAKTAATTTATTAAKSAATSGAKTVATTTATTAATTAAKSAATTAATTAAKSAATGIAARIIAGVISAALIVGGSVGAASEVSAQTWKFNLPSVTEQVDYSGPSWNPKKSDSGDSRNFENADSAEHLPEGAAGNAPAEEADSGSAESEALAAYRAYLDILQQEREYIKAYNWQNLENPYDETGLDHDISTEPSPIAFADVYGDDMPELIYIKGEGEPFEGDYANTSLNIITFQNGNAEMLCSGYWDTRVASSLGYALFQIEGEKTLYASCSFGDEWWENSYVTFAWENGTLMNKELFKHRINVAGYTEHGPVREDVYTSEEQEISENEYLRLEADFIDRIRSFVIRKRYYNSILSDKIDRFGTMQMTYDEAVAYLQSLLGISDEANVSAAQDDIFSIIEGREFYFGSGVGAWGTWVTMGKDGAFTGNYHDSNAGETGDGYPYGTCYMCNFHGQFSHARKINDYAYSMQLEELIYDEPREDYIEDGILIIADSASGIEDGKEFMVYLPGAPINELPVDFVDWASRPLAEPLYDKSELPCYGLYNVDYKYGFVSEDYDFSDGDASGSSFDNGGGFSDGDASGSSFDNGGGFSDGDASGNSAADSSMDNYPVTQKAVKFDDSTTVDLNWGWELFEKDASEYSQDLAMAGCILSQAAEMGESEAEARLESLGFENVSSIYYRGNEDNMNMPGVTFASAKVTLGGEQKLLLAIVVRGSADMGDWLTNFYSVFDGFYGAADNVRNRFRDYCNKLPDYYGFEITPDNTVLFITGHSMAGAVAGELSQMTESAFAGGSNIHTYTFASPNYQTFNYDREAFANVHNIINTQDAVPNLPWGYKRYGHDWYYDGTGKDIVDQHLLSTYLNALLSGVPRNIGEGARSTYNLSSVHCPVDIQVVDEDGHLLAWTEDEDVHYAARPALLVLTKDDAKYVYAPEGVPYSIVFSGTGDGEMTYTQQLVQCGTQEIVSEKTFEDVAIETGKTICTKTIGINGIGSKAIGRGATGTKEDGSEAIDEETMDSKVIGMKGIRSEAIERNATEGLELYVVDRKNGVSVSNVSGDGSENSVLATLMKNSLAYLLFILAGIVLLIVVVLGKKRKSKE